MLQCRLSSIKARRLTDVGDVLNRVAGHSDRSPELGGNAMIGKFVRVAGASHCRRMIGPALAQEEL